jgi:hypothetical protein
MTVTKASVAKLKVVVHLSPQQPLFQGSELMVVNSDVMNLPTETVEARRGVRSNE